MIASKSVQTFIATAAIALGVAGCGSSDDAANSVTDAVSSGAAAVTDAATDAASSVTDTASTTSETTSGGAAVTTSWKSEAQSLIKENCASCHTLAAAKITGKSGPNLDEEKPSLSEVIKYVTDGDGSMPAFKDKLTAKQIKRIAKYVVASTK